MMILDPHDEGARDDSRSDGSTQQSFAALRSLEENGVDVTGSESGVELAMMQSAVDAFRRAAEALAGRLPISGETADRSRQVVPPRAADETPRQYTERVNRMSERFRSLTQGRDRGR